VHHQSLDASHDHGGQVRRIEASDTARGRILSVGDIGSKQITVDLAADQGSDTYTT